MGYEFKASHDKVEITWSWTIEDEIYWEPHEVIAALLSTYRQEISKEICLITDMDDDTWNDFKGGMSTFSNHVDTMSLEYHPCSGAVLTLHKRICSKCSRSCGWASTYCDGTGKSTGKCSDCGTTDSHHGPECVWSKL